MCYFNHKSNLIYDFIFKNRLYLVPHWGTHIGPSNDSAIDLCIVDENDRILSFNKIIFINSYYLIQVTLDIFEPKPPQTKITYRIIDSINQSEFTIRLLEFDWSFVFKSRDLDLIWNTTVSNITNVLDSIAPLKEFTIDSKSSPWLTPELKRETIKLDQLYKRYKHKRNGPILAAYRDFKETLLEKISAAKVNFYSDKLSTKNPPASIWKDLEHLGLTNSPPNNKNFLSADLINSYFISTQNASTSDNLIYSPQGTSPRPNFKFKI